MCTCGSLPDHDECSRCALPPKEKNVEWFDPQEQNAPPKLPAPYDEAPF